MARSAQTKTRPTPSHSRDKTHRVDAGDRLGEDDRPPTHDSKDDRASRARSSSPERLGKGVDERGRYGRATRPEAGRDKG